MLFPSIKFYLESIPEVTGVQSALLKDSNLHSSIFKQKGQLSMERLEKYDSLILLFANRKDPGHLLWTTGISLTHDKLNSRALRIYSDEEAGTIQSSFSDWADSKSKISVSIPAFEDIIVIEEEDACLTLDNKQKWSTLPFAIVPADLAIALFDKYANITQKTAAQLLIITLEYFEQVGAFKNKETIDAIPKEIRDLILFIFACNPDAPARVATTDTTIILSSPVWSNSEPNHKDWAEIHAERRIQAISEYEQFIRIHKKVMEEDEAEAQQTQQDSVSQPDASNDDEVQIISPPSPSAPSTSSPTTSSPPAPPAPPTNNPTTSSPPAPSTGTKRAPSSRPSTNQSSSAPPPSKAPRVEDLMKIIAEQSKQMLAQGNQIQNLNKNLWTLQKESLELSKKAEEREERKEQRVLKSESDKLSKGWIKLQDTTKNLYLTACFDGSSIPTDPVSSFIQLLQGRSAGDVRAFLKAEHRNCNMNICKGFCSALLQGCIIAMPTPYSIENWSIFFMGPALGSSLIAQTSEEDRRLKIQSSDSGKGYDDYTVKNLSKQIKSWPVSVHELMFYLQNHQAIAKTTFGEKSDLHKEAKNLYLEFQRMPHILEDFFSRERFAGACLLERIHGQFQAYIHSCLPGTVHDIDKEALCFKPLLRELRQGSINCRKPSFLKVEEKKPPVEKKKSEFKEAGKKSAFFKASSGDDSDKNLDICLDRLASLKLGENEVFGSIFSKSNKQGFSGAYPTTTTADGKKLSICHRFHVTGKCFKKCVFKDSHKPLSESEERAMVAFATHCKANYNRGK